MSENNDNDEALPGHWNQKSELGGNDRSSSYSWAQCIRAAAAKGLRLTRGSSFYILHLNHGMRVESPKLDDIYEAIREHTPPKAER